MGQRSVFTALVFVVLLLSSGMGCLALVPAREFLESMRDEPQPDITREKSSLNHTFNSLNPTPYFDSVEINVDESVSSIMIYFRANMDFADQISAFPLIDQVRYVNAKLTTEDGTLIWSINATNTTRPGEETLCGDHPRPPCEKGTWILEVEARGYGVNAVLQESYDDFIVQATVVRTCIKYAGESECSLQ